MHTYLHRCTIDVHATACPCPPLAQVRAAIFNMLQSQAGTAGGLPPMRWLDMFAGTGSVGLEALSRGIKECHFIEMDPWIGRQVCACVAVVWVQ